jgi:hypothetical protein
MTAVVCVTNPLEAATSLWRRCASRHNHFTCGDLLRSRISPPALDRYTRWLEENAIDSSEPLQNAPANTADRPAGHADSRHLVGRFEYDVRESHLVRRR